MKKISLLTLLAIPFLAACNTGGNTSLWAESDLKIMEDHLNNNILPYIELDGLTVSYNRTNESVDLSAPKANKNEFESYKNRLSSNGYTEVKENSLIETYTSKGFHTFSKEVNNGVLYVDLYCLNTNKEYDVQGQFNVNAYYYNIVAGEDKPNEWTVVDERIMSSYLEKQILPECDIQNKTVTCDGADGRNGTVKVSAPYANETSVNAYITKLTQANYTVDTTGHEAIGFHQAHLDLNTTTQLVVQVYTYHNGVNLGLEGDFFIEAFIVRA